MSRRSRVVAVVVEAMRQAVAVTLLIVGVLFAANGHTEARYIGGACLGAYVAHTFPRRPRPEADPPDERDDEGMATSGYPRS